MTPAQFKEALKRLNLSVRKAAPHLGVSLRTAYAWSRGEWPIPQQAANHINALTRLTRKHKTPHP